MPQTTTLTYLLDTGCIIAAQTPGEIHHSAAAELVELGRGGRVHLLVATSIEYDLEAAPPDLAASRLMWLLERPFITRAGGPLTLDVSRLDLGDVLILERQVEPLRKLQRILGSPPVLGDDPSRFRRPQFDLHHAAAAFIARADAFVSTDRKDILRKRQAIKDACGLDVLDPETAVAEIRQDE